LNTKATASHIDLHESKHWLACEYRSYTEDLLTTPEVTALSDYRHHKMNRRQHALNVSWYAFRLARRLHMDAAAVARSGLLHDLYYYNFRDANVGKNEHIYAHPQLALANARRVCALSDKEEDIILNHMWPMCPERRPHYKETYLVSCIDKCCCLLELASVALMCGKRAGLRAFQLLTNLL
jgi:uncharacterized protein